MQHTNEIRIPISTFDRFILFSLRLLFKSIHSYHLGIYTVFFSHEMIHAWMITWTNRYYDGLFRTAQILAEQINHLQPPKLPLSITTSNAHGTNFDDLKRVLTYVYIIILSCVYTATLKFTAHYSSKIKSIFKWCFKWCSSFSSAFYLSTCLFVCLFLTILSSTIRGAPNPHPILR